MNKEQQNIKVRTARLSIISNTALIILKAVAGFYSGSVSIISEAIHSALDLVAALIAFFAVKVSDKPADKEHPFGHGKYENVSGVIEALLIFAAAIWIIIEAVEKLVHSESILDSTSLNIGIVVMVFSGIVNFVVSRRLYKVARMTDSLALEADALHLKTDVYTSIGVGVGLLAIQLTGYYFLDPVIALMVALFIIFEAYHMLVKAFNPLLDSSLAAHELDKIMVFIESEIPAGYDYDQLKTRKSGAMAIIQFNLLAKPGTSLQEAVKRRKELAKKITRRFPKSELIIVLESL